MGKASESQIRELRKELKSRHTERQETRYRWDGRDDLKSTEERGSARKVKRGKLPVRRLSSSEQKG